MKNSAGSLKVALLGLLALGVVAQAHAQGGCVNSPENPTALLAVVGMAAAAISRFRRG